MKVSFNAEALAEAEEAARWYLDNGGVAPSRAFVLELQRVVSLAAQQPGIASPGARGTLRLYLKRFPESEKLFNFGDFNLWKITPTGGRFVAGFGKAFNIVPEALWKVAKL